MIEILPSPSDPDPVVGATRGGHLVMWTVEDEWCCTCTRERRIGELVCEHVTAIAQVVPWRVSEALIAARRRAGHLPPGTAKPARKST